MNYVGLVESLDTTNIFLGQALATVQHWNKTVASVDERFKAMYEHLKTMKVEVSKTKQLGVALAKSKELATKLQIDIDKHVFFIIC